MDPLPTSSTLMDDWKRLIAELSSSDVSRRRRAAEQFAHRQPAEGRVAISLLDALVDEDEQVREWATAALEGMSSPDIEDIAGLAQRLTDSVGDGSYWAATLLGRLGPEAAQAVVPLTDALKNQASLTARERAAWALGKIGPAAKSALPDLQTAAKSSVGRLSNLAQSAIAAINSST
jgi:HEAT repeat protein